MNKRWLGAVAVLSRFFLREILYAGPLSHQDEGRRSHSVVLALFVTLGTIMTLFMNLPFLAVPVQLLPPMLFWQIQEKILGLFFLLILGLSLSLWESMGLSELTRRILMPVVPGHAALVGSKLLAHMGIISGLGLAFLLPADICLSVLIVPKLDISIISFAFLFPLYGLALLWLGYFAVVAIQGLLGLLPTFLGRGLTILFRAGLLMFMVSYLLMPSEVLSEWLGNLSGASSLTCLWPVAWFTSALAGHFVEINTSLVPFMTWGLWGCLVLPLFFFIFQFLSVRSGLGQSGQGRTSSGPIRFGRWKWLLGRQPLCTFFFRVFLRRHLLRRLLISLAVPGGITLIALQYELRYGIPPHFIWPSLFAAIVLSAWFCWLVPMLAWLCTLNVSASGAWVMRQLPQAKMHKAVRRAYFKMMSLILTGACILPAALVFGCHPWPQALRMLSLFYGLSIAVSAVFCHHLSHWPFIARLLPDPWHFGRFWILYALGYLLAISILNGLVHTATQSGWPAWGLILSVIAVFTFQRWRSFDQHDDRDLSYEQAPSPVISAISDYME